MPQILRHNAKFDFEKLIWLQGEYCRELPGDNCILPELGVHAFAKAGVDAAIRRELHPAALDTCKGKIKTFSELPAYAGFIQGTNSPTTPGCEESVRARE
ncbi:MAG: hypothetical protein U1F83_07200 [Verrucomicrobiota bacterium]